MSFCDLLALADLALKVLEESLAVEKSDDQVKGRTDGLDFCIERECTRRCFWLIQCMSWISGIYIYKPMRPRSLEMTKKIRLPIDETTFDLAAHWSSASEWHCSLRTIHCLSCVRSGRVPARACADDQICLAVWSRSAHLIDLSDSAECYRSVFISLPYSTILTRDPLLTVKNEGPARQNALRECRQMLSASVFF